MPAGRLEYKYLVPLCLIDELRAAMMPYVCYDAFCRDRPQRQYTVRSIYYDNRRFDCYYEKFDGFRLKKKLRIRGYNTPQPDSIVFLEIKRKQEDFISKSRAPVRWQQVGKLFGGYDSSGLLPFEPGSAAAEAASRFFYNYHRRRMLATVLIAYEREAFFGRFDPMLRLTFDKNVRSRMYPQLGALFEDREMKFVMPESFVFELKFYMRLPLWVRDLIRRFELQRLAISKYAMGIDVQRLEKKFIRGVGHRVECCIPIVGGELRA